MYAQCIRQAECILVTLECVLMQYLGNRGALDIFPVYSLEVANPNYLSMDGSWNWIIDLSRGGGGNVWGTVSDVSPAVP